MTNVLGYLGMGLVMGSFLTKDIKTLRILNMVGCVVWIAYGIISKDTPIIATNGALLTINSFRLWA